MIKLEEINFKKRETVAISRKDGRRTSFEGYSCPGELFETLIKISEEERKKSLFYRMIIRSGGRCVIPTVIYLNWEPSVFEIRTGTDSVILNFGDAEIYLVLCKLTIEALKELLKSDKNYIHTITQYRPNYLTIIVRVEDLPEKLFFDELEINDSGIFIYLEFPRHLWALERDKVNILKDLYHKFRLKNLSLYQDLRFIFKDNSSSFSFGVDPSLLSSLPLKEFEEIIYSKSGECLINYFVEKKRKVELWNLFLNFLKEL